MLFVDLHGDREQLVGCRHVVQRLQKVIYGIALGWCMRDNKKPQEAVGYSAHWRRTRLPSRNGFSRNTHSLSEGGPG